MIENLNAFLEQYSQLLDYESKLSKLHSKAIKMRRKMEKEYFKHYIYETNLDLVRKVGHYLTMKKENK